MSVPYENGLAVLASKSKCKNNCRSFDFAALRSG